MSDRRQEILAELERLRARQAELEAELAHGESASPSWPPVGYYTAYHLMSGALLGILGASLSLLFNVIGSTMVGKHPLEIIRVYLTFPMGETALAIDDSSTLAIGIFLYLGTGMLVGALIHVILSRWFAGDDLRRRFLVTSILVLGIWIVNYYAVLSWLQPLLFDGNWILQMVPWWVAAATHLVFGWTVLFLQPWGRFEREQHT